MHVDFIFTYTVSSISTCQQVATCFITYSPTLVQISVLHCSSVFTPQHISTRSYSSRPALHRVLPARIHPDSLHTVYYPLVFIPTCFTPCITRSHSSRLAPHRVLPAHIHPYSLRIVYYPFVFILTCFASCITCSYSSDTEQATSKQSTNPTARYGQKGRLRIKSNIQIGNT